MKTEKEIMNRAEILRTKKYKNKFERIQRDGQIIALLWVLEL